MRVYFWCLYYFCVLLSLGGTLFMVSGWITPSARKDPYYKGLDQEFYIDLGNYHWFTLKYKKEGTKQWLGGQWVTHKTNRTEIEITMGISGNCYTPVDKKKAPAKEIA
jgi:hypothetical protein